ncbi:hypothetical protein QSV34_11175 [Porticoccus sp. W117]|uniref:PA1571 family protein n=1 Tax=Porticoccus sp. W117 TaxID=3054777 RepID=UPI00259721D5|nr:PA1571 family protein [Porticoccus sp. W117]MDM3871913.1 hypothetical protein [Porticoccus sp. W117]
MTQKDKQSTPPEADFHGAAIVDESGKEQLITEEMVQSACDKLDPTQEYAKDDAGKSS